MEQAHIKLSSLVSDLLGACTQLHEVYRRLLKMALEELRLMAEQIEQLGREALGLLQEHQDVVQRVAEGPGGRRERRRNKGVRYEERGPAVSAKSKRTRAACMVKEPRKLGHRVEGGPLPAGNPA